MDQMHVSANSRMKGYPASQIVEEVSNVPENTFWPSAWRNSKWPIIAEPGMVCGVGTYLHRASRRLLALRF